MVHRVRKLRQDTTMSSKKSSGSVKKVKPETFNMRDIVLGKVLGWPPWPGMVVDPDTVPKAVSKERPSNTKNVMYAIKFFVVGDYAWLSPKELSHLTPAQIDPFVSGARRAGPYLMEGYKKALDRAAWEEELAANLTAAKKPRTKSKANKKDDEEVEEDTAADEDEIEEEAEEEKAGKKRKRASPAPAKTKAAKAKKGGKAKKSKAAVESEVKAGEEGEVKAGEEGEGEGEGEGEEGEGEKRANKKAKVTEESSAKLESDPAALQVHKWRHKLQKTLLSSNKTLPKEEVMPAVDALFTTIEGYRNMSIECLTFSKIGKVMRHIHLLEPGKVPRDDEYKFRDRAKALIDKWHGILNANKATEGENAAVTDDAALNGADVDDLIVMDTHE
ncbi:hypothetical protein B0H17DRAFT_1339250 [Mycena rosella]|uniref:PWWP domain-containing protein n=1 Tax=Mycena rosella TaxID=1033263 RepID=A0AAD7C6T0_MYCRO|nr:hypothetical protein B0H17DRAFT_1339250 [Mycena rosella]